MKLQPYKRFSLMILLAAIFIDSIVHAATFPEFECYATEPSSPILIETLGKRSSLHFSLRKHSDGDWEAVSPVASGRFPSHKVSKLESVIEKSWVYKIHLELGDLKFVLRGTPPSRQGELWLEKPLPGKNVMLSALTCH